jgi:hypothetical protein
MRQPTAKAIVFFVGALLVGYALAIPVATAMSQTELTLTSFANITAFAILFAVLLTVWLDKPLELELIKWPEKKPEAEQEPTLAPQPQPEEQPQAPPGQAEPQPQPSAAVQMPQVSSNLLFPHEPPAEHWDVDFGNSKEVYEGTELPVWILAGWAVFILWAVIYLISGLPTAF